MTSPSSGMTWVGGRCARRAAASASIRSARPTTELEMAHAEMLPAIAPNKIATKPQPAENTPVIIIIASASAGGRNPATTAAAVRKRTDLVKGLGVEAVPHAADGQDQFGVRVVLLDVLAQPPHVHIDGPRLNEGVATPDQVEQLLA